ncbi:MFS transporter [Roseiarcaceae bacterium H3SJ34-1]|uniref:MFS transporter n=1 Tax=Terripilifer ovatus TaxID=3032367 RepID=UPI003AB91B9E|nr:MFS transporter [Roseiarcaceae bacterium H3SJ34-1]
MQKAKLALFFGLGVSATGQSLLLVVLPPLGRNLGFSDIQTGSILSASALLLMASAAVWGHLSDRIGRRPVILVALFGIMLAAIGYGIVVHLRLGGTVSASMALLLFVCIRSAQAIATSGLLPAAQGYMADITNPLQRAGGMAILGVALGVGATIGAAIAWRVAGNNPVLGFGLVAVLAVLASWCALLWVAEPGGQIERAGAGLRISLSEIWPFLAITVVSISAYGILNQVAALRLQDGLGFTVEDSITYGGAALMATALTLIVFQALAVSLLQWSPSRLLTVGSVIATVSMFACALASDYKQILATLIILGAGLGLMLPGNMASLSLRTDSGDQGRAAGLNVVAQGLGQVIGPIAGASLHGFSVLAPFAVAAFLLGSACIFAFYTRRPSKVFAF